MAAVHLGRALDGSGEVVALKIIKDDLSRLPGYLTMFHDEAAILGRMQHPNIVRTLESGVAGSHRYIAMELLLGRTLAEVFDRVCLADFALPPKLVAWIGARVAAALHYAHVLEDEHGVPLHVVHRDANPSNIVLTYDGEVKLIDFGLAKAARRNTSTEDGIIKGKVPYLAPEQILEEEVDARTDIFTLGATLWETLAMRRLFKRDTDLETIHAIREGHVPALAEVAPRCGVELAEVVTKCLARERRDRYASADLVAAALDAIHDKGGADNAFVLRRLLDRTFPGEREQRVRWRTDPIGVPGG